MMDSIYRLREISRKCLTGEPLPENLSVWLGLSLQEFLRRSCGSVDEALGLQFPRGGVPWWLEEAIRTRDAALRELGAQYLGGETPTAMAREIASLANRYAATAWRFDREREHMPLSYLETARHPLWRAFKSGAVMPLGVRQLRNILAV